MNANLKEIKCIISQLRANEDPDELLMKTCMGRAVLLMRQLKSKFMKSEGLTDNIKVICAKVLDDCKGHLRTLYFLFPSNDGRNKVERDIQRIFFILMDVIIARLGEIATCILVIGSLKLVNHKLKRYLYYQMDRRVKKKRRHRHAINRRRHAIKEAIKLGNEENRHLIDEISKIRILIDELEQILRKEKNKKTLHYRFKVPDCRPTWRHLSPFLLRKLTLFKSEICSPRKFKTQSLSCHTDPIRDQSPLDETRKSEFQCELDSISQYLFNISATIEDIWHIYFYETDHTIPKDVKGRVYVVTYIIANPKSIETSKIIYPFAEEEPLGQFLLKEIWNFESHCELDAISEKTYILCRIPEPFGRVEPTIGNEVYLEFQDDLPDLEIEDNLEDYCQPISVRMLESESATIDDSPPVEYQEDIQDLETEESSSYTTALEYQENWYGEEYQEDIQDLNTEESSSYTPDVDNQENWYWEQYQKDVYDLKTENPNCYNRAEEDVEDWHIHFYEIDHTIPKHEEGRVFVKPYILANPKSTENSEVHSPILWKTPSSSCHEEVKDEEDLNESSLDNISIFKSECEQDPSFSIPSVENEEDWIASLDDNSQIIYILEMESRRILTTAFDDSPPGTERLSSLTPPVEHHKDAMPVSQCELCQKSLKYSLFGGPQSSSKYPPSVGRREVLHDLRSKGPSGFKTPVDEKKKLTPSGTNYIWIELTFGERRQSMLRWCRSKLQGYGIPIRDFTASWKNGRALVALIHCHRKHLIEERFLTKESRRTTLIYGAQIASSLGVRRTKVFVQECLKKQPSQFKIMPYVEQLRICLQPPRSRP